MTCWEAVQVHRYLARTDSTQYPESFPLQLDAHPAHDFMLGLCSRRSARVRAEDWKMF